MYGCVWQLPLNEHDDHDDDSDADTDMYSALGKVM